MNLTSNPNTEKLKEVEVKGRKVYVNEKKESAFVETDEGLVSMTNLRAWNFLIERAKRKVIDDYEHEKSIDRKQLEEDQNVVADKIRDLRRELGRYEGKIRSTDADKTIGDTDE